jgi:integrase
LSLAQGQRLEIESAKRREGFTSNVRDESLKPIEEPLGEYLTHIRTRNPDEDYLAQLEQRIRRVLTEIKARRLLDITLGKVESALLGLKSIRGFQEGEKLLSITTRNEYATSITGFTRWAKARRKLEYDPLEGLTKPEVGDDDRAHPRRALTVDEVSALLNAAARRPVAELMTVRVGQNKGKLEAKVRPAILERARILGINRRLAYLVAVWTGLRREELEQLEWRDVLLDVELPFIQLRAGVTKSKRADALPLHPQLAAELLAFKPANAQPTDRVLPVVPAMNVMRLDLKFAGIDYGDQQIGYADLHAQRTTMNTMLASQGIDARTRQAQLRHTDPRLTEVTYFDKQMFVKPQALALNQAAAIPGISAAKQPAIRDQNRQAGAELAQEIVVLERHPEALPVTLAGIGYMEFPAPVDPKFLVFNPDFTGKKSDPASFDTGSLLKRAKGVEPAANHQISREIRIFSLRAQRKRQYQYPRRWLPMLICGRLSTRGRRFQRQCGRAFWRWCEPLHRSSDRWLAVE